MNLLEDFNKEIKDDRRMKSLTGLTCEEFEYLIPVYKEAYAEIKEEEYLERKKENPNTRKSNIKAEFKGKLNTYEKKLFINLYYLKTYPTFDVLAFNFGISRTRACYHIHRLTKIVARTFEKLGTKPKRKIETAEDFLEVFGNIEELIVDVTERRHFRHKDYETQKFNYSGKKNNIVRKIR